MAARGPQLHRRLDLPPRMACICLLAAGFVGGCANDAPLPVQALTPARSNPPVSPVPLLEGMSVFQWSADHKRLAVDIERAMNQQEWALLSQEEIDGVIHAKGVVPDNRQCWIIAWQVGESDVALAVRVGLYGDETLEGLYAARLKLVMAGKPKPKRYWGFELPPLLPSKE